MRTNFVGGDASRYMPSEERKRAVLLERRYFCLHIALP